MLKRMNATTWIVTGAILGAASGAMVSFTENGLTALPWLTFLQNMSPFSSFLTTAIIEAVIGSLIGLLAVSTIGNFGLLSSHQPDKKNTLLLREERLDISKERIKTADVKMHKETITEEKTITVPLTREELVIEKKVTNEDPETIRIPLTEEELEIDKHTKILNEVNTYKNSFETTETIEEDLRKEELLLNAEGDVKLTEIKK